MNDAIRPQPGILDIALYQGGQSHLAGMANVVKLSSNENPFGPGERAKEVFLRSAHTLHRYPNTDHAGLRQAIAEVHGLDAARVICGVGSDEIITFLCQAYAGPGDEVIHTEHGFLMYRISALAVGATPVEVPERERTTDVDAILAACNRRTKLVFIANPNNPTGTASTTRSAPATAAAALSQTRSQRPSSSATARVSAVLAKPTISPARPPARIACAMDDAISPSPISATRS